MNTYQRIKRVIDVAGAAALLVVTAPLILVIALAIRVNMGAPVLFRQQRPGLGGALFTCVKFRTMNNACAPSGALLDDRSRTTRLGAFLRRTSLDELPQLWNILRGDLSFIGPRPLLAEYLPYYTPDEKRRHAVRPGLTGWAQVNGRNQLSFAERLALDVWYVDHVSAAVDAVIFCKTCWIVLTQRGYCHDVQSLVDERQASLANR